MPLKTTCIGAWPKPEGLPLRDWFMTDLGDETYVDDVVRRASTVMDGMDAETRAAFDRATADVVRLQVDCGVDVPTDGEMRRENYVHYHCRHLDGFDFDGLTKRVLREGAYNAFLPTVRGKIAPRAPFLPEDWRSAQAATDRPVKITLPGPLTVIDTTADEYYGDPRTLAADLADALNAEVRALADAGCRYIQIDEPIFARRPQDALDFGIDALARCFHGLPAGVVRVMHMCCGYPDRLDNPDYPKADPDAYMRVARTLDGVVDEISIEDSHRHNPPELFEAFEQSALIVGFIKIASSAVESVDEIVERMRDVMQHIPKERLIAAPDCGLGFLGAELAEVKMRNLCAAAKAI
ncbi:MAG: cobalamin-independent methionine synthase II family protein [Pseudomonadota bacterium]